MYQDDRGDGYHGNDRGDGYHGNDRGDGYHGNARGHRGGRHHHDRDSHGGDRSDYGYRSRGRGGGGRGGDLRENMRRGGYRRDYEDRGSSYSGRRSGGRRPRRGGQTSNYKSIGGDMRRSRSRSRSKSPGTQWYKVTVHEGNKHEKNWLFQQLNSATGIEFEPISFHVLGDKVMFYTQDADLAQSLKRITIHSNAGKLSIKVWESEAPREQRAPRGDRDNQMSMGSMEEDPTEVVQDILYACYDTNSKTLNMEKVGLNDRAKQHNLKGFFNDSVMVNIMLNLIGSKCPDLAGLNLSGNSIQGLNHLIELPSKAPELRELDLSNNRFAQLQELEKLRGFYQLKILSFYDNPCCKRYKDINDYRREIRAIFPQLVVLDNEQLSEPIILGTENISGSVPTCKASFLGPADTSKIVLAFIENYYKVFDSAKRDDLIMGYDTNSFFSISINSEPIKRGPPFTEYTKYSRNLVRCKDTNKRRALLLCGRIDIVHQLRQLPQTQHNPDSFIVDVMSATNSSIVFNVWGLFYETAGGIMRGFSRTFHIAINQDSILIKNDQLTLHQATDSTINAPTRLQTRETDTPNVIVGQVPTNSTNIQTLPYTVPTNFGLTQTISQTNVLPLIQQPMMNPQEQIVQRLSQDTRMKPAWAQKCLEQNEWSYENALEAFSILQQQNIIPQDALL